MEQQKIQENKSTSGCKCPHCGYEGKFEPGIILDPFCGSGTVGLVAKQLNRNFIGIELNKDYCELARKRIASIPEPMF